jgi:hypothetical protein
MKIYSPDFASASYAAAPLVLIITMLAFVVSSLVVLMSLTVPAVSLTNAFIPHIPYFHTIPP